MGSKRGQGDGSVYQLPDGRWRAQVFRGYSPAGSRLYRTKTVPTKTAARNALRDLLRDQHAGSAPQVSRGTTVKTYAEQWLLEHERSVRPKTFSTDAGAVRKWIIPTVGRLRLDQLAFCCGNSYGVAMLEKTRRGHAEAGPSYRAIRVGAGIALRDVARYARVSPGTVSRWERGQRDIHHATYLRLVAAAGHLAGREGDAA